MAQNIQKNQAWGGDFGRRYTDRNPQTPDDMDVLYRRNYGVTRSSLNQEFLDGINRELRILEVGANIGVQLQFMQGMGFQHLYGVDFQAYAIEKAKKATQNINLIQGNALDIPFKDGFFDLVYTSGVLIHIDPDNILEALKEIYRCSNHYIWGFEYFSEKYTAMPYRGKVGLLWKADFARMYLNAFPDLELVKEKRIPYLGNANHDSMFLLKKVK